MKMKIPKTAVGAVCVVAISILAHTAFTQQEVGQEEMIGTFNDWALTIAVLDAGPIIGATDLEVRHPTWISRRPANAPPRDPTDPVNIAEAWMIQTFTNMRDANGTVVPGATLVQEWVAVSPREAAVLEAEGYAILGSSGGFILVLIRQTATPQATDAFGLMTIDNGEFIHASESLQGICG